MTALLQKAFDLAAQLPEAEQETLASLWIEEMKAEQRWQALFAHSQETLEFLAEEALAEFREGKTQQVGWDEL